MTSKGTTVAIEEENIPLAIEELKIELTEENVDAETEAQIPPEDQEQPAGDITG